MKKLVDSFGRSHNYLRMSLTEKCNLRCKYCMPLEGVSLTPSNELLSLEERKKLISIFASLGVNKIRFTGGEPTLSTHLVPLIKYAHSCGIEAIGITTNGIELGRNPQRFEELVDSGLTSINISLDTLNPSVFERVVRRKASLFDFVQRCITHSLAFEALKVKLNVVMMKGINDKEFPTFVALTKENNLDCRFIELMPFDGNDWTLSQMMTFQEALVGLQSSFISNTSSNGMISHPMCHDYQLFPINYDQSDIHDTTKWYRMISEKSGASFLGRVGFISSMTSNFCQNCNRLRITADGKLKVCLFGDESHSLREDLRGGVPEAMLIDNINTSLHRKAKALGGHEDLIELSTSKNRPMILIGG